MDFMSELISFIQSNNIMHSQKEDFFRHIPKELLRPESEINELTSKVYKVVKSKHSFHCLYPGCCEKPIKSHSIQKSLLKGITDETNHVLNFSIDAKFNVNGNISVKQNRPGIKDASTFEGFCNKHDTEIFLPIEKVDIDFSNNEHCFLLLYRSVVREYYESRNSYFLFKNFIKEIQPFLDKKNPIHFFLIKRCYLQYCEFFQAERMKKILDECYLRKIYNCLFRYKYAIISKELPFFANTYFCVQGYKNGKMKKIDITKDIPYSFSITILPSKGKTYIFYAYLEKQETDLSDFLKLFETTDEIQLQMFITDTILRNSDNFYISPKYWNNIPEEEQNELLSFFKETIFNREFKISNDYNLFKYIV